MCSSDLNDVITTGAGANQAFGDGGNDQITGGADADALLGGAGNDTINGAAGTDTITGGAGVDTMLGGADADRFVFAAGDTSTTSGSIDRIDDFVTTVDKISFGVTGSATNYTEVGDATFTYAQALEVATSLITGGQRDIVAVQVGATDVYVFADIGGTNTVNGTVELDTVGGLTGVAFGDFVA